VLSRTRPHGRRNGRSWSLLNDGAEPVVTLAQLEDPLERSSDEPDGFIVIVGVHIGPGVEAVETRTDRRLRNVESR
jgi:hypothetical protein